MFYLNVYRFMIMRSIKYFRNFRRNQYNFVVVLVVSREFKIVSYEKSDMYTAFIITDFDTALI